MALNRSILLADDEPHILLALEYMTRTIKDVTVFTATDGPTAVDLACKELPSLILMDVMMPQIDGYTACGTIRRDWKEKNHNGKIWFITARSSSMDNEHAKSVGADHIVHKPFDPDALLKMINDHLTVISQAAA